MNVKKLLNFPVVGVLAAQLIVMPALIAATSWSANALTKEEVDAVASQTTVIIGQGLQKGQIEARREFNPGSGVIVARSGNTYYALTALHVVEKRDTMYGIRTSDGEVHFVDDEQTKSNIIPLGSPSDSKINGFDLAIVKFESQKNYPVITMGNSGQLQFQDPVYVSGWPNPENESPRRERRFSDGNLTKIIPNPFIDGGYSMLYSNFTHTGMSGGPVLNSNGELVGIHGRGRAGGNQYCVDPQASQNNSCGMQMVHFLSQTEVAMLHLSFNQQPVDPQVITAGINNRHRADVINNIYEDFSINFVQQGVRNGIPSGGCGTILTGDPCDGDGGGI